jgi:hypothetical protein
MNFTVAWSVTQLLAALKSKSLADAPKLIAVVLGVVFGWVAASLVFLVSTMPYLSLITGFLPTILGYIGSALQGVFPGLTLSVISVTVSKAWDIPALIAALKSAGIADAEILVQDDVDTVFVWIVASMNLGNAIEKAFAPAVQSIQTMVDSELASYEAKLAA